MIHFVSTFSRDGFDLYGRDFIRTFQQFNRGGCRLHLVLDWDDPELDQYGVCVHAFDEKHREFCEKYKDFDHPSNYRHQMVRFAHKVFAYSDLDLAIEATNEVIVWIDADVVFKDDFDEAFFTNRIDEDVDIAYLGRKDWDHSETGFIWFSPNARQFMSDMRASYIEGYVETLPQQHDAHLFDHTREFSDHLVFSNISEGCEGMHVWPQTFLNLISEHHKGVEKIQHTDTSLEIVTRNCVADEVIQGNIEFSMSLLDFNIEKTKAFYNSIKRPIRMLEPCMFHDRLLAFVSAGPSVMDKNAPSYHDVWTEINNRSVCTDVDIAVVKHSHDELISRGIIPKYCLLLDPRNHVAQFIEHPHPDVIYIVSSMVAPNAIKRLIEADANIVMYHAGVNAGERDVILANNVGDDVTIFTVGTSASTRGLAIFHHLGYTNFDLFGYDACFLEKPDESKKEVISINAGKEETGIRQFWTTKELTVQVNDVVEAIKGFQGVNINLYGDGLTQHVVKSLNLKKRISIDDFKQQARRR